jgi:hypothetical protein
MQLTEKAKFKKIFILFYLLGILGEGCDEKGNIARKIHVSDLTTQPTPEEPFLAVIDNTADLSTMASLNTSVTPKIDVFKNNLVAVITYHLQSYYPNIESSIRLLDYPHNDEGTIGLSIYDKFLLKKNKEGIFPLTEGEEIGAVLGLIELCAESVANTVEALRECLAYQSYIESDFIFEIPRFIHESLSTDLDRELLDCKIHCTFVATYSTIIKALGMCIDPTTDERAFRILSYEFREKMSVCRDELTQLPTVDGQPFCAYSFEDRLRKIAQDLAGETEEFKKNLMEEE